jgi:hypothetical protein
MDDGLRLFIDDELVIDEWHNGALRQVVTERYLEAGSHTLATLYYDAQGVAQVHLWWERPDAYPDWKGVYWANTDLRGNPALIRNDPAINFDWGEESPSGGLPRDQFSVRWTRHIPFDAGTYRFHIFVDDGIRLWIDDQLIVDAWYDHSLHELTADHPLTQGDHIVRLEYYENKFKAQVSIWWERVADLVYPDWKGEYWANQDLYGDPVLARNETEISFRWDAGSPAPIVPDDRFSARWSRRLGFEPGRYRFYARADDGIRFYVDGRLVLDEWHSALNTVYEIDLSLSRKHVLRVEFYENIGDARAYLWWRRIGDIGIYPY